MARFSLRRLISSFIIILMVMYIFNTFLFEYRTPKEIKDNLILDKINNFGYQTIKNDQENKETDDVQKSDALSNVSKLFMTQLSNNTTISESGKIDWHDYARQEEDASRTGPGEQGRAVRVDKQKIDRKKEAVLLMVNGFNAVVSDLISVNRSIDDLRYKKCRKIKYEKELPMASIIIPFFDEHWSTLLRTVHTLLERAPSQLIADFILVDDFSTKKFLGERLEKYMTQHFPKVKIIRNKKREGLIRTRLIGAKIATGDVLIFIDSHCEAGLNWLPPLLEPIKNNYKTVTCPFIDVIDMNNFRIQPQDEGARGAFDWNLDYKRLPRLPEDEDHPEKPFDSPVMAGGLFAISKKWFWTLGGYDKGLEVWGGEQYELSFKIWMCGGTMIDIPCSRIGHVYRKFNPFGVPGIGDYVSRNYKRIAEVWMDGWKKYVYKKHIEKFENLDPGNLDEQKELRRKLKCKSFDWFMKHVAFDLEKHYPAEEPKQLGSGMIMLEQDTSLCLDTKFGHSGDSVKLEKCISNDDTKHKNGEQYFKFGWRLNIRPIGRNVHLCLDYPGSEGRIVILFECHNQGGNQLWRYNPKTHQLYHPNSDRCLDSKPQRRELFMTTCSDDSPTQKWTMTKLDMNEVHKQWKRQE